MQEAVLCQQPAGRSFVTDASLGWEVIKTPCALLSVFMGAAYSQFDEVTVCLICS